MIASIYIEFKNTANPLKVIMKVTNTVIHTVTIDGRQFYAEVGHYLGIVLLEGTQCAFESEIGNAEIRFLKAGEGSGPAQRTAADGYFLCRYDDERRIDLTSLSEEAVNFLAGQFGLMIYDHGGFEPINLADGIIDEHFNVFCQSICAKSLATWVIKHPQLALKHHIKDKTVAGFVKDNGLIPLKDNEYRGG